MTASRSSARKLVVENIASLGVLQAANYVLPLITLPYLVRVLGAANFGLIAFAHALNQYFVILTDYGFNLSATRRIAIHRERQADVSEAFNAVMVVKLALMLISLAAMIAIVRAVPGFHADATVYFATFPLVAGSVLFPGWLFQGLEKMRYIAYLNLGARLIALMATLALVRRPSDYLIAALAQALGPLLAGVGGLCVARFGCGVRFAMPRARAVTEALRDGWQVFVTSIMMNVVSNSGVFVLGLFKPIGVVGAYAAVERLVKAMVAIFAPVTQAVFPLTSARFAEPHASGRTTVIRTGRYTVAAALAISAGCAVFAKGIISVVYGSRHADYSAVVVYLAVWMLFGVINNSIGIQYLVGSGRSREYRLSFTISAAVALALLFIFVPGKSYYGVLYGMVAGEVLLTAIMLRYAVKTERELVSAAKLSPAAVPESGAK